MTTYTPDTLHRFIFENIPARGLIVQLNDCWKALQSRKDYPAVVQQQLGEFIAANALLAASLKLNGSMTMQIQSDGPINLMVMECNSEKQIRGLAKYHEDVSGDNLSELFGDGQLVITIDNAKSNERYQGIVELKGEKISHALENYLKQSEQLETFLFLAANENNACGILIQKMPGEQFEDTDDWIRINQLAETLKTEELFHLSAHEIIHRLYHEDDVRVFDADHYQFQCSCSRERVSNMLLSLGHQEIDSIIAEQGSIEIDCEFCNQHYAFDKIDAQELFATDIHHPSSSTRH